MRRVALQTLVASVAISAALGIYSLLAGEFNALQGKILITSFTISGGSVLAMACGIAWERGRLGLAPPMGVGVSLAGSALFISAAWSSFDIEPLNKSAASVMIVALALALASVVSLATLPSRHRWVQLSAYALATALVATAITGIWAEWEGDGIGRAIGVEMILLAAATILVPVLQRMARPGAAAGPAPVTARVAFCPACGAALDSGPGRVTCPACGARFTIEFAAGRA